MPHLLSPWVLICSQNRTSGCLTEDEGQLYGVLLILLCFFRSRHLKSSKHLWRKRSLSSSQSPRFITLEMENNSFLTQDYITLMSSLNCLSQSSTSRFTCTAAVKWASRQTVRPINCISLCLSLRHRTEDPHCRDFFLLTTANYITSGVFRSTALQQSMLMCPWGQDTPPRRVPAGCASSVWALISSDGPVTPRLVDPCHRRVKGCEVHLPFSAPPAGKKAKWVRKTNIVCLNFVLCRRK